MAKDTFEEIMCLKSWGIISEIDDFDIEGISGVQRPIKPIVKDLLDLEFDFVVLNSKE